MESVRRIGMYRESPGSDIVKQGYLKKLKVKKMLNQNDINR